MDGRPRIESKLVTTPLQVALLLTPQANVDVDEEEEAEDDCGTVKHRAPCQIFLLTPTAVSAYIQYQYIRDHSLWAGLWHGNNFKISFSLRAHTDAIYIL